MSAIARRNFVRVDLNNIKIEPVEMADFDIWSEGRHGKRHLVSPLQQAVHHKGIKDVAHRRGPAFHCKNIKSRRWSLARAHFFRQILLRYAFGVDQYAVGGWILVAYDAVNQLVHKPIWIELEFSNCVVDSSAKHTCSRGVQILSQEVLQPF